MSPRNFTPESKVVPVLAAQGAGTGDTLNFTEVDMQGFESVMFVAKLGAVVGATLVTLNAKNSDTSASYGAGTIDNMASASDAPVSAGAADANKIMTLEIHRPKRRYVRGQLSRAGGTSAVIESVFAILFNPTQAPVTRSTSDQAGTAKVLANPVPSAT